MGNARTGPKKVPRATELAVNGLQIVPQVQRAHDKDGCMAGMPRTAIVGRATGHGQLRLIQQRVGRIAQGKVMIILIIGQDVAGHVCAAAALQGIDEHAGTLHGGLILPKGLVIIIIIVLMKPVALQGCRNRVKCRKTGKKGGLKGLGARRNFGLHTTTGGHRLVGDRGTIGGRHIIVPRGGTSHGVPYRKDKMRRVQIGF